MRISSPHRRNPGNSIRFGVVPWGRFYRLREDTRLYNPEVTATTNQSCSASLGGADAHSQVQHPSLHDLFGNSFASRTGNNHIYPFFGWDHHWRSPVGDNFCFCLATLVLHCLAGAEVSSSFALGRGPGPRALSFLSLDKIRKSFQAIRTQLFASCRAWFTSMHHTRSKLTGCSWNQFGEYVEPTFHIPSPD
jgi:hypothetical protein